MSQMALNEASSMVYTALKVNFFSVVPLANAGNESTMADHSASVGLDTNRRLMCAVMTARIFSCTQTTDKSIDALTA